MIAVNVCDVHEIFAKLQLFPCGGIITHVSNWGNINFTSNHVSFWRQHNTFKLSLQAFHWLISF